MMSFVFFIFEVFSLILIGKISVYADGCTESKATVEFVTTCPHTTEEWEQRSARKNCKSFNNNCNSSFVYHCVMNTWQNKTLEVCAPSVNIIGSVCAEYNTGGFRIQRNGKLNCSSCPTMYISTDSFKYRECYKKTEEVSTASTPEQTTNLLYTPAASKEKIKSDHSIDNIHTIIIVSCSIGGVLVIVIFLTLTRKIWINFSCTELKKFISRDDHFPQVSEGENIRLKENETPGSC